MKKNDFGLVRTYEDTDEIVFLDYDETKDYIISKLGEIINDIRMIKFSAPKAILEFIKDVVTTIQEVDDEFIELSGEKKLTLATDVIIWVLYDELDLDIPYVPDFIEKRIFKPMLKNMIIPFIVDWFKNKI